MPSKNAEELKSFVEFCEAHPEQRFGQALRNWSGWRSVIVKDWVFTSDAIDTFYMDHFQKRMDA